MTASPGNAGPPARPGHEPYIRAVQRSIEARDIAVTALDLTVSADGVRAARLMLRPDQDAFPGPVPAQAQACWDEERGWSMMVPVPGEAAGSEVFKGLDVLPAPDDVASWAVVLLAHPELTPSYEDYQFGAHSVTGPEFELRLARYAGGM